jgi:hypothetical protein
MGIDNGGKDGVTFEKFVFRKRRSVGGDRLKRRSRRHAQRRKRIDLNRCIKAGYGEQCCMMSTGRNVLTLSAHC